MSAAGDFAYSYGRYSLVRSQDSEKGHYLQIWRTDDKGAWKIVARFPVAASDWPEVNRAASLL